MPENTGDWVTSQSWRQEHERMRKWFDEPELPERPGEPLVLVLSAPEKARLEKMFPELKGG